MSEEIKAPFTEEQAVALNRYQNAGRMHPFTCPRETGVSLVATINGWECPVDLCGYTQDWAWAWMTEPELGVPL